MFENFDIGYAIIIAAAALSVAGVIYFSHKPNIKKYMGLVVSAVALVEKLIPDDLAVGKDAPAAAKMAAKLDRFAKEFVRMYHAEEGKAPPDSLLKAARNAASLYVAAMNRAKAR